MTMRLIIENRSGKYKSEVEVPEYIAREIFITCARGKGKGSLAEVTLGFVVKHLEATSIYAKEQTS